MRGKIAYGLVLLIVASVNCGLTPPDSPDDIDAFNARSDGRSGKKELNDVDCSEMNTSCIGCINLEHCYFAIENDGSTKCDDRKTDPNAGSEEVLSEDETSKLSKSSSPINCKTELSTELKDKSGKSGGIGSLFQPYLDIEKK